MSSSDPGGEYRSRLAARQEAVAGCERLHRIIGNARLLVFVCAAAVAWLVFGAGLISAWWLAVPGVVFLALLVAHDRVLRERRRLARAVTFYEDGIARLEDRWAGKGESGERYADPSHPYAEDLDLFGKGSVFELLCTARTPAGEDTLASWLKGPATPAEIRGRQEAVDELRNRLDLREYIEALGSDVASSLNPEALTAWGAAPPLLASGPLRASAAALGVAGLVGLVLWAFTGHVSWLAGPALVEAAFALPLRSRVRRVIEAVEAPGRDLALLAGILRRFEREQFRSSRLVELRRALETAGQPPSARIAALNRLIVLLDSRRNQIFGIFAALMLWATQMAFAIEAWRRASGPAVARWLAAAGELEALCALAGHAYEHPFDPFPEIVAEGPIFEALALGHPLLPESRNVRNDVTLGSGMRVLVVSGSNMSGKSTLLRSVGVNTALALAGASVRAAGLRVSPLAMGASIRITDSLQAGSSRFYAEITRLRRLVDITHGPLPLLFLLDELLQGTNSHDRRIGAEAVVEGLVRRGAVGLLTTHDLALSHIADALAPRAANVHFEDRLEDGRMVFDYRLRPGVVQRSNALELMRSIGLEV